jgi:hypothetical protein
MGKTTSCGIVAIGVSLENPRPSLVVLLENRLHGIDFASCQGMSYPNGRSNMRQPMIEHKSGRDASVIEARSDTGRVLTYDEIKAAEAAFRGEPFNPAWSAAAAQVYAGISAAMADREASTPLQSEADSAYIRY